MFLAIAAIDSSPQPTKSEKIFSYIKVGLPTSIGLVQQPVQIVVRYRSHNLTLFVRPHFATAGGNVVVRSRLGLLGREICWADKSMVYIVTVGEKPIYYGAKAINMKRSARLRDFQHNDSVPP